PGRIATRVVRGGALRSKMGLALAGRELPFPAMTAQDRRKLTIAVDSGADWIGVSMVQGPRNIAAVRRALARLGAEHVKVVAKIESRAALDNLDAILDAADAVMIARGDLATAVGDRLPAVQARIAARARARGKPFIVASNLLSAMQEGARPSRANRADVRRARAQRPAFLMLNETALGADPGLIVETLRDLTSE
ncbi:MAG TPA: pyruvate kinase, partial [Kofleriaceae bacterium]|nr:pyruvate kinase [Kofleriaceae bacterium]